MPAAGLKGVGKFTIWNYYSLMANKVFFSWQSDIPNRVGRTFLKEILEEVCKEIASDTTLDEAVRDVAVDSDTQGVAGKPPVAITIFNKIDTSAVFVADMTFAGKRINKKGPIPNPNVLIEYGWALKALGHERVIDVMNIAYGKPSRENLPFDLVYLRWPITYNLPEDASAEVKSEEKRKLSKILNEAIRASLATKPTLIAETQKKFPEAQAKDGPARFRAAGEALGFEDDTYRETSKEIFLSSGPAMWLRLMPSTNLEKKWTTGELKTLAMQGTIHLLPLIHSGGSSYSFLRASDGEGMYRVGSVIEGQSSAPHTVRVDSVAIAFRTGEIWSVETALLAYKKDRIFNTDLEKNFAGGAENYREFLKKLGINPPFHWKAGLIGVRGRHLGYEPQPGYAWMGPGPICSADLIEAEGTIEEGQNTLTALLPFFKKIFEECGIVRPDYLPK